MADLFGVVRVWLHETSECTARLFSGEAVARSAYFARWLFFDSNDWMRYRIAGNFQGLKILSLWDFNIICILIFKDQY